MILSVESKRLHLIAKESRKEYESFILKIDLKNRYKTSLTRIESKELNRLINLRFKHSNNFTDSL